MVEVHKKIVICFTKVVADLLQIVAKLRNWVSKNCISFENNIINYSTEVNPEYGNISRNSVFRKLFNSVSIGYSIKSSRRIFSQRERDADAVSIVADWVPAVLVLGQDELLTPVYAVEVVVTVERVRSQQCVLPRQHNHKKEQQRYQQRLMVMQ